MISKFAVKNLYNRGNLFMIDICTRDNFEESFLVSTFAENRQNLLFKFRDFQKILNIIKAALDNPKVESFFFVVIVIV